MTKAEDLPCIRLIRRANTAIGRRLAVAALLATVAALAARGLG